MATNDGTDGGGVHHINCFRALVPGQVRMRIASNYFDPRLLSLHLVLLRRGRADLKLARCAPFSASEARVTVAKLAVEHRARAKLDARATRAQLAVV